MAHVDLTVVGRRAQGIRPDAKPHPDERWFGGRRGLARRHRPGARAGRQGVEAGEGRSAVLGCPALLLTLSAPRTTLLI